MFIHAIEHDALLVIKTFNFVEGDILNFWRVIVMHKTEKHCQREGNEIYERYCFHMQEKLPTVSVDSLNCCRTEETGENMSFSLLLSAK